MRPSDHGAVLCKELVCITIHCAGEWLHAANAINGVITWGLQVSQPIRRATDEVPCTDIIIAFSGVMDRSWVHSFY